MWNVVLWIVQVLLALMFLFAGSLKALRYDLARKQMKWVASTPEPLVRFIGAAEILGGIGLIIPALTHIQVWLTPLAAAGIATILFLSLPFHGVRSEWDSVARNLPLLALALFAAVGRFVIAPF